MKRWLVLIGAALVAAGGGYAVGRFLVPPRTVTVTDEETKARNLELVTKIARLQRIIAEDEKKHVRRRTERKADGSSVTTVDVDYSRRLDIDETGTASRNASISSETASHRVTTKTEDARASFRAGVAATLPADAPLAVKAGPTAGVRLVGPVWLDAAVYIDTRAPLKSPPTISAAITAEF